MDMDEIALQFEDIDNIDIDSLRLQVATQAQNPSQPSSRKLSGLSQTSSCLSLLNELVNERRSSLRDSLFSVGSEMDVDIDSLLSELQHSDARQLAL
jgi:hypothetical protein